MTGRVYLIETNVTVRVTFVRPNFTWIDCYVIADNETGEFFVSQAFDMIGYWNVFPILGHMSDRLGIEVVNPAPDPVDSEPVVNLLPVRQTSTSL